MSHADSVFSRFLFNILFKFCSVEVVFNRGYVGNMDSFAPPIFPKSEKDRVQLLYSLEKSFLTQSLSQSALQTIIESMHMQTFKAGDNIVTQGENGTKYYILKTGKCQVIVNHGVNSNKG